MVVSYDPRSIQPRNYNAQLSDLWEAIGPDWVENEPTLINVTLGAGGSNRMWRKGKGGIGHLHGEITLGSSPTMGAMQLDYTSDGATSRWAPSDHSPLTGSVFYATPGVDVVYFDTSAGNYVPGTALMNSGNIIFARHGASTLSATAPFTWAAGDQIIWRVSYLRSSGSDLFE